MPTPNDFTRVTYGGSDSTGRQDSPAMEYGQVNPSSTLPGPSGGNYPATFGGEPADHYSPAPDAYPNVFSRVSFGGDNTSDYKTRSSQGQTGNFGQAVGPNGPKASTNQVPSPSPSKQFSSDTNGNPNALLAASRPSVDAHASLNECYGLTQPIATPGSHPWLRDSLTNTSTEEAGNAGPNQVRGVPLQRSAPNK
jgi:hypothetical protein